MRVDHLPLSVDDDIRLYAEQTSAFPLKRVVAGMLKVDSKRSERSLHALTHKRLEQIVHREQQCKALTSTARRTLPIPARNMRASLYRRWNVVLVRSKRTRSRIGSLLSPTNSNLAANLVSLLAFETERVSNARRATTAADHISFRSKTPDKLLVAVGLVEG